MASFAKVLLKGIILDSIICVLLNVKELPSMATSVSECDQEF